MCVCGWGLHRLDEMVRSSLNTCDAKGNVETFLTQILSQSRNQKLFDFISEGAWKVPSYQFLIFCRVHVNNGDITIVMRHSCDTECSIYSHGSEAGPDEKLVRIGYFKTETFEYEFKHIFPMVYDTLARHLSNKTEKCPKLNQNGVINISRWNKLRLTLTA